MKLKSLLSIVILSSLATAATAQQTAADREKARKDSIGNATMTRLDQNSSQMPRRDTMRAGTSTYRERTQIIRKNGKDSVVVIDRQYSSTPDPNAIQNKPVQPVMTPAGYDPMTQQRQEVIDRIDIAIQDLDDEIAMISNLRSTGTKSPSQNWKTRNQRLKGYRSKLNNIASTVKSGNARELRSASSQAMATIRESRVALTNGNRR
ncbi:MAG: hypothetical protein LH606_16780 [Cytophagaceae bacterium]|nr:hypothetical protein [Cytophagaceae bacterium]